LRDKLCRKRRSPGLAAAAGRGVSGEKSVWLGRVEELVFGQSDRTASPECGAGIRK
jgi:hypothetical protein